MVVFWHVSKQSVCAIVGIFRVVISDCTKVCRWCQGWVGNVAWQKGNSGSRAMIIAAAQTHEFLMPASHCCLVSENKYTLGG